MELAEADFSALPYCETRSAHRTEKTIGCYFHYIMFLHLNETQLKPRDVDILLPVLKSLHALPFKKPP